jgi:hypothetical protein
LGLAIGNTAETLINASKTTYETSATKIKQIKQFTVFHVFQRTLCGCDKEVIIKIPKERKNLKPLTFGSRTGRAQAPATLRAAGTTTRTGGMDSDFTAGHELK